MIDGEDAATSSVSSSVVQPATEAAPPTPSAPSNRRRGSGIMGGFLPQVSVEQPALSTGQTILIRLEPLGDVPRGIYMGLFEAAVNGAIDRFRSVFALVSEHVVTAARCVSLRPKPPPLAVLKGRRGGSLATDDTPRREQQFADAGVDPDALPEFITERRGLEKWVLRAVRP